jgi:hypothetical protein
MFRGANSWQFLELVRQLRQQRQNGPNPVVELDTGI